MKQTLNVPSAFRLGWSDRHTVWLAWITAWLFIIGGYALQPALMPYALLALGIGVPALAAVWVHPEWGLVALVFLTASIFPPDLIDLRLSIGGGLDLRDLVFLGLGGICVLRQLASQRLFIPWLPVGGPLLLFLGITLVAAYHALIVAGVAANWALNDLRHLLYYSVFFFTAWSITRQSHVTTLLIGLFIVADMTAGVVIIQQYLGADTYLLASMGSGNWQVWEQAGGTVRVVPPGHTLMHFMAVFALSLSLSNWRKPRLLLLYGVQFVFLSLGLLLTFTRAGWIASGLAFLIVLGGVVIRNRSLLPHMALLGLALVLLLGSVLGLAPDVLAVESAGVQDIAQRFATLFTPEETIQSHSLQWRLFEFRKASEAIRDNPWLGVGLGNVYRNLTIFQGEAVGLWTDGNLQAGAISRFTRYIHSSYVSIATKSGLLGIGAFLWYSLAFVWCGGTLYLRAGRKRQMPVYVQAMVLAAIAGFLGLLQWSLFHAWLVETESTSVVGVMTGLVAALRSGLHASGTPSGDEPPDHNLANRCK